MYGEQRLGILNPKKITTLRQSLNKYIGQEFMFTFMWVADEDTPYEGQSTWGVEGHRDLWRWLPEEDIQWV